MQQERDYMSTAIVGGYTEVARRSGGVQAVQRRCRCADQHVGKLRNRAQHATDELRHPRHPFERAERTKSADGANDRRAAAHAGEEDGSPCLVIESGSSTSLVA